MRTLFLFATLSVSAVAADLEVGPSHKFTSIEAAVAAAQTGDVILVHPLPGNAAYARPAVFVRKPRVTIRGVGGRVRLDGKGFNYSGIGRAPRAMFQFEPGADGCVLEGFEMFGARGEDHNGSGVRIQGANRVTVRNCDIHHNDMGIMSNGDGTLRRGANQLIESCTIHHNGSGKRPGYNHNLYLGGASATLRSCEVHHSTTGHNVKSRCHITRIESCYIHHSANREFDLVDGRETAQTESDAILVGNVIFKDPDCPGNRNVIHFGQDGGGKHRGTLRLSFNTIVTPFASPIVRLSAPDARTEWIGNLVIGEGRNLVSPAGERLTGHRNWIVGAYRPGGLAPQRNTFADLPRPRFENPGSHDFRPTAKTARKLEAAGAAGSPRTQYAHPCKSAPRPAGKPIPGAVSR